MGWKYFYPHMMGCIIDYSGAETDPPAADISENVLDDDDGGVGEWIILVQSEVGAAPWDIINLSL